MGAFVTAYWDIAITLSFLAGGFGATYLGFLAAREVSDALAFKEYRNLFYYLIALLAAANVLCISAWTLFKISVSP